jgi:hypothetical protein
MEESAKFTPDSNAYAKFLPLVQSSGTGKSRMVDEMAKEMFLIPLNVRRLEDKGNSSAISFTL